MIRPNLYGLGESLEAWAGGVLDLVSTGPLILVGSSVGGSCALEVARLAPDRVAAVALIGAKAGHRPKRASETRSSVCSELKGWPRGGTDSGLRCSALGQIRCR